MIYLDNAATTPIRPEVIEAMTAVMKQSYGNPSSIHSSGREASQYVREARQVIAQSIGAAEDEIIFTGSGSEGDNQALIQGALMRQNRGRHIISTSVEHPAVKETLKRLENDGFEVTYLPVDEEGYLTVESVKQAVRDDTVLVSVMSVNNETGVRYPIEEIGSYLRTKDILFHTDAVQAYASEDIDVKRWNVDLLTVAAHKINGPKGVGALYVRKGLPLLPHITGGEQEGHLRAGTENVAGLVGFAKAAQFLTAEEKAKNNKKYITFHDMIKQELKNAHVDFQINGSERHGDPHILNLWLKGVPNQLLLTQLDLAGINVSTGSACTAGNIEPSHVLEAMYGKNFPATRESIRLSFGYQTTEEEVQTFCATLIKILNK